MCSSTSLRLSCYLFLTIGILLIFHFSNGLKLTALANSYVPSLFDVALQYNINCIRYIKICQAMLCCTNTKVSVTQRWYTVLMCGQILYGLFGLFCIVNRMDCMALWEKIIYYFHHFSISRMKSFNPCIMKDVQMSYVSEFRLRKDFPVSCKQHLFYFFFNVPHTRCMFYSNSFFPRRPVLWIKLLHECFPSWYKFGLFKLRVNKYLELS